MGIEVVWPRKVGKLNSKHGKKVEFVENWRFGREMIDPISRWVTQNWYLSLRQIWILNKLEIPRWELESPRLANIWGETEFKARKKKSYFLHKMQVLGERNDWFPGKEGWKSVGLWKKPYFNERAEIRNWLKTQLRKRSATKITRKIERKKREEFPN